MKHKITFLLAFSIPAIHLPAAICATLVWDSFEEGGFAIPPSRHYPVATREISSPFFDTRMAWGYGRQTWSATMANGQLEYRLHPPPGPEPPVDEFVLSYTNGDGTPFSVPGYYEAFALNVVSITGRGWIVAYTGPDPGTGDRAVPLDHTGPCLLPLTGIDGPIRNIQALRFRIAPETNDFSVSFSGGISLVPEPSALLLALAGGCTLACRRRRRPGGPPRVWNTTG